MTQPARSTWPETAYALSLTKVGNWRAQRTAMELFCAHAFAHGVISGPFICSRRDLASHLYRSAESGQSSAGELLAALVKRGVLRELGKGSGTAPSEYDVAHWTRWNVPWRIREASALDRMIAFAASEIRPLDRISGRIMIRSLAKSARGISDDISSLAAGSIDQATRSSTAFSTPQVRRVQSGRYIPPLSTLSFDAKASLSRKPNEREQKLIDAFKKGAQITEVRGVPLEQIFAIAAMANGSFDEICRQAADPAGPSRFLDRLAQLRQFAEAPFTGNNPNRDVPRKRDRRREGLESTLAGLEKSGDGETAEAYELRQQLATLDACEQRPA